MRKQEVVSFDRLTQNILKQRSEDGRVCADRIKNCFSGFRAEFRRVFFDRRQNFKDLSFISGLSEFPLKFDRGFHKGLLRFKVFGCKLTDISSGFFKKRSTGDRN